MTNVSEIGNEGRDTRWQETSYVKAYDGRRDRLTFRAAVFGNEHSLTDINNGAQTFLTGGPLGTGRVSYQYNNSGDNITGAAINGNWIDVTDTLTALKQTRDNLVNTPYAIDFDDTRYLTEDSNGLTLNFEDEAVQNTFVIKVSNSQIAGKTLNIKLRDEQNVIFVATPDKDSGALGSAHMHVYVDGELIGPDPEAGKGTRYNYSILWAIPEGSEEVNLVGNMFFGSVLAPSQTVQSYTNFNGTIVADTYLGSSAETHSWTYNPTTEVEPEPEETQLVVKKTVEGSDDDKNKEFKFVITRLDEENFDGTLKMKINGQGEEINLKFTDGKSEEITVSVRFS
ncbi:choice-of-anchor A family protein [Pediococcus damnosus]|uniref:choice-of-anchor A family protein n=1 Tax=Pediococcus damnosus TaxID=51663 RepID=UPI003F6A8F42